MSKYNTIVTIKVDTREAKKKINRLKKTFDLFLKQVKELEEAEIIIVTETKKR